MGFGGALKKLGRAVDPTQVTHAVFDEVNRLSDRVGEAIGSPESIAKQQKEAAEKAAAQEKQDAAKRRRQLFARAPGRVRRSTGRQSTILTERLGGTSTPLG